MKHASYIMKLLHLANCLWERTSWGSYPTVGSGSALLGWGSRWESVIVSVSWVIWIYWTIFCTYNNKAVHTISSYYNWYIRRYLLCCIHEADKALSVTMGLIWWIRQTREDHDGEDLQLADWSKANDFLVSVSVFYNCGFLLGSMKSNCSSDHLDKNTVVILFFF